MPAVQAFGRSMLENYLRSRNLKYFTDSDGDMRLDFAYEDDTGCELTLWLMVVGSRKQICTLSIISDLRIPKKDWAQAVAVCNTWNKDRRWPTAYLYVRDANADTSATIKLEQHYDLTTGITQELLDETITTIVFGGFEFWRWAKQGQRL